MPVSIEHKRRVLKHMERQAMAKKPEPKPLFQLKTDFYESLDNFANQAGMLADAVRTALGLPGVINNHELRRIFQERLDAFAKARFTQEE